MRRGLNTDAAAFLHASFVVPSAFDLLRLPALSRKVIPQPGSGPSFGVIHAQLFEPSLCLHYTTSLYIYYLILALCENAEIFAEFPQVVAGQRVKEFSGHL